ncbi:MAG TPA: ABC transporter permease [Chryseosolibacter sp.]
MFRNYLKTAWRNIVRQKGSTIINISGLTLGISCSIILFLLVAHISSYDNFQSKRDRIYRVVNQSDGKNGTNYQTGVPTVLPEAFKNEFHEAEEVVFTSYRDGALILVPQANGESKKFQEESGVVFTDPAYFKTFDRKVITGDPLKGIDDPNEAMISVSLARKYFGKEDAIGEVVKHDEHEYKITGILEDSPSNTDFPFDLILSYSTIKAQSQEGGWGSIWSNEHCYFLLREGEDIAKIDARLPAFSKKYLGEDDFDHTQFITQAMKDFHYDERFQTYSNNTTPRAMIIAFGVIALVLVITACINFINLATAEAIKRSKEVGVRKSLGSSRGQLVRQFLGETTIVTVVSVITSLALSQVALNFLNPFMELELELNFSAQSSLWIFLIGLTVGVSLLSGLYPAFVISGFNPALVLKNQMSNKGSSSYFLRRSLVVTQFMISQLLIIITIVIIAQMNFSKNKDLGFTKDAILFVPIPEQGNEAATSKMKTLREEMLNVPGVEQASLANTPPSSGNVSGTNFSIAGIDEEFMTQVKTIDGNYLDLYDLELIAGKNVQDLDTTLGYIVNEKLAKHTGAKSPEEMLGKEMTIWGKKYPIVGVVKDFHTVSLRRPIEATAMFNRVNSYRTLGLKIDMQKSHDIIDDLKEKWESRYPEHLFEYEFLDQSIAEFYDGERRMSILLSIFTSMAIFIGCLGLFGLATFMANQKTKEIGVRKVLGASVSSIVMIFSREYLILITIGFVLAAPLGYFAMSAFLNEFEYKIPLGPGIFITGLVVTLAIAALTVGFKSFRAATANPVKSLRYE